MTDKPRLYCVYNRDWLTNPDVPLNALAIAPTANALQAPVDAELEALFARYLRSQQNG